MEYLFICILASLNFELFDFLTAIISHFFNLAIGWALVTEIFEELFHFNSVFFKILDHISVVNYIVALLLHRSDSIEFL